MCNKFNANKYNKNLITLNDSDNVFQILIKATVWSMTFSRTSVDYIEPYTIVATVHL